MSAKTCEQCISFHRLSTQGGQCRYEPPKFGLAPVSNIATGRPEMGIIPDAWPVVGNGSWCSKCVQIVGMEKCDEVKTDLPKRMDPPPSSIIT